MSTTLAAVQTAVAGVLVLACGLAGGAIALAVACERRRLVRLRRCPLCAADAVEADDREQIDELRTALTLRCGQCGTWRRRLVSRVELDRLDHAFERDRRTMADRAQWLEADRTGPEVHDFVSTLRREIVGSDDFLAQARRADETAARRARRS